MTTTSGRDAVVEQVGGALREVAEWWVELHAEREPGTRRRWHEHATDTALPPTHDCGSAWLFTTPVEVENADGSTSLHSRPYCPTCSTSRAIGESRAPLRIDALDAITNLGTAALALEARVRASLGETLTYPDPADPRRPEPGKPDPRRQIVGRPDPRDAITPPRPHRPAPYVVPDPRNKAQYDPETHTFTPAKREWRSDRDAASLGDADPRVRDALLYLHTQLPRIARDAALLRHVEGEVESMRRSVRLVTGRKDDVVALKDAPCHLCGCLSLVVRVPYSDEDVRTTAIVECTANHRGEEPVCLCASDTCPCRNGGRHAWPEPQWQKLVADAATGTEATS